MTAAKTAATVKRSALACPNCHQSTPMAMLRGDRRVDGSTTYGLRLWENDDLVPRPDDVFQERLYCIRWVETIERSDGSVTTRRHYRAPDAHDLQREDKVLQLLRERFRSWQEKGYLPSRRIEPGYNTDQPIRERGWTHWHHLFHPRQLLVQGLLAKELSGQADMVSAVGCLLGLGKCLDKGSKLCYFQESCEVIRPVFVNQAFNTFVTYGIRTIESYDTSWYTSIISDNFYKNVYTSSLDARNVNAECNVWITDPPYADAVNYHELSEFFLAWYETPLQSLFSEWYADSKRALAITGSDEGFRKNMVNCYRNLAAHMSENGLQIVMFTHQNAGVWADLALILWASGLQVTAAWTIATETDSALKGLKKETTSRAPFSSSSANKPQTTPPSSMKSTPKSSTG